MAERQTIRWRTIRQRRLRARKGQVSAVATVLGLLLVTSMIAEFVLVQLPNEMEQNEFEHLLLVENQLGRLQATVTAQAQHPATGFAISSPVTLGSAAQPPFAPASSASLGPEGPNTTASFTYTMARLVYVAPDWEERLGCAGNGSPCNNKNYSWDNVTAPAGADYTFKLNGETPALLLNFTGAGNSITVTWLGQSNTALYLVVSGSDIHVDLDKGSAGGTGAPHIVTDFYGENDVLDVTDLNGGDITLTTNFYGNGTTCPAGDLASTDRFYWNDTSVSDTTVDVTWYNDVGRSGVQTFPVGSGSSLTFRNTTSALVGCAWQVAYATSYALPVLSGIDVHLNDRYSPVADVVYDGGAVILSHPGIGSIMVDPPAFDFTPAGALWDGNLTLVTLSGSLPTEYGYETTGVVTRVAAEQQFTFTDNPATGEFLGGLWLNLTTPYPFAWESYFTGLPSGVVAGVSCTEPYAYAAPYTCLVPPPGAVVQLSVLLTLGELTVTDATVAVSAA